MRNSEGDSDDCKMGEANFSNGGLEKIISRSGDRFDDALVMDGRGGEQDSGS